MKEIKRWLPLILWGWLLPYSMATEPSVVPAAAEVKDPFKSPLIIEILELHSKSEAGDKQATKELVTKLEALVTQNPQNYLLLSYLGSAYTLASRDAFYGPNKYNLLVKGLKILDSAVESAPQDCSVRFIRAVNNYHLPTFINRRDNAREDFKWLVASINMDSSQLSDETRQAIYYFAGLCFKQTKKNEEARESWNKGLGLMPDSDIGIKIKEELQKLK